MESQNSEMLTSYDEGEIAEKAHSEIEGEYFLVPDIPENVENDIQVIVEEESPSMSQMCRICATVNGHLVPIFKEDGLEHDLCKKIDKHLPIKVFITSFYLFPDSIFKYFNIFMCFFSSI